MKGKRAILAVLYVVLAAAIVFAVVSTKGFGLLNRNSSGNWQAVFLDNGQVYFGHLSNQSAQYATLTNIYYLQVQQQQGLQNGSTSTQNSNQQPQLSLIKLGNELHGPEDTMYIATNHILFIENMKSDSKVVTAINDYIKNPNKQ